MEHNLLVQAVLVGLAAWRITAALSYERGPFNLLLRLRERLNVTHDDNGQPIAWPDNILASLISCVWCLGIYATLAMFGLWYISKEVVVIIAASSILISVER